MDVDGIRDDLLEMLGENVDEDRDLVREENAVGDVEAALTGAANHAGDVDDRLVRKSRGWSGGRGGGGGRRRSIGGVRDEDEDAEKLRKSACA